MKDSKFIEVGPEEVNDTIETWASFGWEMVGAPQEINYSTTHRTQETDEHYASEYTTTTHYVKIMFQRDNSIPNYSDLVTLEKEYNTLDSSYQGIPVKPRYGFFLGILTFVGMFFIVGILILILRLVFLSKKKKAWAIQCEEIRKKNAEIANRQKAILTQAKGLLK